MTFRRTRCAHCRAKFEPERPSQIVHAECAVAYVVAEREKDERAQAKTVLVAAKVEKAEIRRRKEAIKKLPELKAEAQIAFNAFIRERDKNQLCICCGLPLGAGAVGGSFDCGHYRSVGSAAHLRYDERNAHAQRKQCNRWGAGRAVDYRIGLIARIGLAAVEAIEASKEVRKFTADELREIRDTYRAKTKELKRGNPC